MIKSRNIQISFLFPYIKNTLTEIYKDLITFLRDAYHDLPTRFRIFLIATPFASNKQMKKLYDTQMFETKGLFPEQKKRIKRITQHKNLNKNLAIYLASNAKGEYIINSLLKNKSIPRECRVIIALRKGEFRPQQELWRRYR